MDNLLSTDKNAMKEKMIATNESLFKAWNTGDQELMLGHLADNFTRTENGEKSSASAAEYINMMKFFRTAIPDLTFEWEVMTTTKDKTFTKWVARGHNNGKFGEQPPTGKHSVTHGFTILTFNEDGVVEHEEAYIDKLSYLEDWGYILTPPNAS
jgi:steroid delta-isomerase-like uncharacterized protein